MPVTYKVRMWIEGKSGEFEYRFTGPGSKAAALKDFEKAKARATKLILERDEGKRSSFLVEWPAPKTASEDA